jgi:membrane-associated PAP2 superfamily phosphatase
LVFDEGTEADDIATNENILLLEANSIHSSIVAILELISGAQCLIEVIRFSGEEM